MNNEEIDNIVYNTFKDNKLNKVKDFYLTNKQIDILKRYDIDYQNVSGIKELLFIIEDILDNDEYDDDLENLSNELAEFNYYHNTNK